MKVFKYKTEIMYKDVIVLYKRFKYAGKVQIICLFFLKHAAYQQIYNSSICSHRK